MFEICDEHKNLLPSCFNKAISLAEELIKSQNYQKSLLFLLDNSFETDELDRELNKTIKIDIIESKEYLGCYGIVSRSPLIEDKIFLNPLMLNQMRLREIRMTNDNSNSVIEKNTLFLCIKIVHEFSHLINYSLSLKRNVGNPGNTPEKTLYDINPELVTKAENTLNELSSDLKMTDSNKNLKIECFDVIATASKTIIDDFGEMMEIRLFGGVIEHKEPIEQTAFAIEDIIIYDFSGASKGYIAKWSDDIFSDISHKSMLIKDTLYNSKSYMKDRKQFLPKNRSSYCSGDVDEEAKTKRSFAIRS